MWEPFEAWVSEASAGRCAGDVRGRAHHRGAAQRGVGPT